MRPRILSDTQNCGKLCAPPWVCLPRPSLAHQQTSHAAQCYRQHNVHHTFVQRKPALICEKSLGSSGCQLWYFMANANLAQQPGNENRAHSPHSPSLIVYSETSTPVTSWGSFCRVLAVPPCTKEQIPVLLLG